MRHAVPLVSLAVLLAAGGCGFADPAPWSKVIVLTVDHEPEAGVLAVTENGAIEVRKGAAGVVSVRAEVRTATEERLAAVAVSARYEEGELRIATEWPAPGRRTGEGASYEIELPSAPGITLTSANGRLAVHDQAGALRLRTSNGEIVVDGHEGAVDAETSNGAVNVSGRLAEVRVRSSNGSVAVRGAAGAVDARTSNGSVDLELARSFRGTLSASTSNGTVDLVLVGAFEILEKGKEHARVRAGEGPASEVETSNGSIRIRSLD